MKNTRCFFFDVDGTLLDFDKAERIGIEAGTHPLWRTGYRGECAEVPPFEQKLLAEVRARGRSRESRC